MKLSKADTFGAITVMHAALEQIVAHLQGVDLNNHSDSDVTINFEEDLGEGMRMAHDWHRSRQEWWIRNCMGQKLL